MNNLVFNEKNFLKSKKFVSYYKDDLYIQSSKNFINKILNTIKSRFSAFEQIDIYNLREFWLDILEAYQNKIITKTDVFDVVDSLENYVNRRFEEDYPDFEWLIFPDSDSRSIGCNTTQFVRDVITYGNLESKFVTILQNYLQTPLGKEEEANNFMDQLFNLLVIKWREKSVEHPSENTIVTWEELQSS